MNGLDSSLHRVMKKEIEAWKCGELCELVRALPRSVRVLFPLIRIISRQWNRAGRRHLSVMRCFSTVSPPLEVSRASKTRDLFLTRQVLGWGYLPSFFLTTPWVRRGRRSGDVQILMTSPSLRSGECVIATVAPTPGWKRPTHFADPW